MSALSMHLAKWIPAIVRSVTSDKWTSIFLIFMNGTWPSGTHWHSAKWYPGLKYAKFYMTYNDPALVLEISPLKTTARFIYLVALTPNLYNAGHTS